MGLLILASLLWAGCGLGRLSSLSESNRRRADSTVYALSPAVESRKEAPRFFEEFRSATGWVFTATNQGWIEAPDVRADGGIPVKTLVRAEGRKMRVTFYETDVPRNPGGSEGQSAEAKMAEALAYLFKADPEQGVVPSGPPEARFYLFKSPKDTLTHFGIMVRSESALLFVNVESKEPMPMDRLGVLPDIRMDFSSGKPQAGSDSSRRSFYAAMENTWGLKAVEDSSWQKAMKHFQNALDLDSAAPAYLMNCAAMYQVQKEDKAGIDFLLRHPALLAASGDLAGTLGAMYEELGNYEEAKSWALKALELDPRNIEWLINLSDALWGLGERVHSKNVLLRSYAEKPTFRLSVYLASTYLGLDEYENAKQVLLRAHQDTAATPKSVEYYLRSLAGLKEYEAALDFVRDLGEGFPSTSNNQMLKAICEFNLKLYRLAAQSAKASLDLDPTNREAQQLATQIAALMGKSSNLILRNPIAPLKTRITPVTARALLKNAENQKWAAQYPMALIDQDIVFAWAPKSRWKKTRHQIFHIRDPRRLIRLSELYFELMPGYSRFYVNAFRLYDANLKLLEEEKVGDFYVTKNHNTTLHPENLLVHLPIKAKAGAQYLEVVTTEEAQLPANEFPYLRYENAFPFPVLKSMYEIAGPPRQLLLSTFGEAKVDSLPDRLVIKMDEPTPPFEEKFSPSNDEFGTGFSATAFSTWREVGRHYYRLLQSAGVKLDSVPFAVRERAQEIIDHNRGMNPVRALFRFVRDSVRYNNYEFSLHALIPDKGENVLANGYADCKGHALLLMQLIQSRGLDAHLCLASLNHAGDIDQPTLHQFNHMIVHVPAQKGLPQYFLDPTEKEHPFRRSPLALEGKNVLIVDEENSRMATIPELDSADEHKVQVFHTLRVEQNQSATGQDSMVLTGKVASEFREHMRAWNPATKYENLLSWLAQSYPAFSDERFRILNEEDPDAPLVMVFRYRRKFPFRGNGQEFEHYPKLELSFLRFPKASARQGPVYFPHEIQIGSQWVYEIPSGFGWKSLTLDRELSENYLHWLFSINQGAPESIVIKQSWKVDPFVATPEEYAKIQSEWDPILAGSGLRLVISKL
jgi:tetratricopeptide (TPR) repeat protein